ncbi:MAG: DUF6298 domain-containing protein [Planctomycetota bacterium]|nr:DUF6298 domain-containing protein [Planctomycetota bacterium]
MSTPDAQPPSAVTARALAALLTLPVALAGSLPAVEPAGRLEVCPKHPYYFRDGERHVVLVGVSDRALFTIWENRKGFHWRTYLEVLEAHGINYVRQDLGSWGGLRVPIDYPGQFSSPRWVFARSGPGKAIDGRPRFDLRRYDQGYFDERLKPFLREAARRGIYVELTLFEEFRSRRFADSLYADANNVNRLGLAPRQATSDRALEHPALREIQQAYVDKVLEETVAFGHVIYEISNETGGRRWVAHFVDTIRRHPRHPGRLVSAGEQTTAFDPRKGRNDIVVKHRGGGGDYAGDAGIQRHHRGLLGFRVGKPVLHNEYFLFANRSTSDVHFPRKMMWGDFTAGGHSNFFDFRYFRGTGRTATDGEPSRSPPAEILQGARHLRRFLDSTGVEFWSMAPRDELASVEGKGDPLVFTLARPGEEYVSYVLGEGEVDVRLDLDRKAFVFRWYDPKSGRFVGASGRSAGGKGSRFSSPTFRQDVVLHVRAGGER